MSEPCFGLFLPQRMFVSSWSLKVPQKMGTVVPVFCFQWGHVPFSKVLEVGSRCAYLSHVFVLATLLWFQVLLDQILVTQNDRDAGRIARSLLQEFPRSSAQSWTGAPGVGALGRPANRRRKGTTAVPSVLFSV